MKGLIFAEGNGYGHVSRDIIISEQFGFNIMTFGKGAEYLKMRGKKFIEIPSPYVIKSENGSTQIKANVKELIKLINPNVAARILKEFRKVDFIIVDGSPVGLILAKLADKKSIFITNDISSLVGFTGIQRRIADQLNNIILTYPEAILIPDFPPPLTLTRYNIEKELDNIFIIGPLIEKTKQIKHNKILVITTDKELNNVLKQGLGDSAIFSSDVGNVKPYYEHCKFVISHGGHTTLTESLFYGKASVVITDFSYSERRNHVRFLEEMKLGIGIEKRMFRNEYLPTIIESIDFLDNKRLKQYKNFAKRNKPLEFINEKVQEILMNK